jgi:hypothetical protein
MPAETIKKEAAIKKWTGAKIKRPSDIIIIEKMPDYRQDPVFKKRKKAPGPLLSPAILPRIR